ncbi:MAG: N-6 DNA methylase, partial [Desulfurococcus sp.]
MRLATALKYYHELDVNLDDIGRRLVEEGIYGVDALRYASQITAINLALMTPGNITRENVYTIYLGYIPKRNQAWLGSLELLNDSRRVGGLLAYIEGGLRGIAERTTLEGSEGEFSIPDRFDLTIMNPPFTRATGRTERFRERRGLFGFITDESVRQELLRAYENVRNRVRESLRSIATENMLIFPNHIQEIVRGTGGLEAYLNIGQAGEGLLFLYLAYKLVRDSGVIAFVLPRGLLAGVSWFLARVLLASKFHVKYIVVSSDPDRGYNFSEGTSLSETLVVAKRVDRHSDDEETVFINLLRKPTTALEAVMLAEEIRRGLSELTRGRWKRVEVSNCSAIVFKVYRGDLLANVDNWNKFVATVDERLWDFFQLPSNNRVKVGGRYVGIPLVRLRELISSMGIDAHEFHDNFDVVST